MDYKEMSLEEIKFLWDEQMVYMLMGTQDKVIINDLAKEVKSRNEMALFSSFQRELIKYALHLSGGY